VAEKLFVLKTECIHQQKALNVTQANQLISECI